jgi:hypothetical protein
MGSAWADGLAPAVACIRAVACISALSTLSALFTGACRQPAQSERALELETGRRFVGEPAFRRAALERSLAERESSDARLRLASYGAGNGWEALPVSNPEVAPVIAGGVPAFTRLWSSDVERSGDVEWTDQAWRELGRRAFEEWPAQRLPQASRWLPQPPEAQTVDPRRLQAFGVWMDDRARVGGLVWTRYPDGTTEPALSCASCHARPGPSGELSPGVASDFDLGAFVGEPWGKGHVDVTVDGLDNPVAIPDLRATRYQRRLHYSGNLQGSLEALAVRTETLLISARANRVRPPREIAWAIAYYVWSLGERDGVAPAPSPLFAEHCGHCHASATGAGDLVSAGDLGIDDAATRSSARGTGGYRVPSLRGVSQRTRLTHLGWPVTLAEFLDPKRPVTLAGHAFGFELSAEQRAALVRELEQW